MKLLFLLLILFPLTVLSNRRYYACKTKYYNNLVFCYEDDNEINCVSNSDNYFTYKDNKCFYIHNKSIDKIIISKYYQIKNFDTFVLCQYSENFLNDELFKLSSLFEINYLCKIINASHLNFIDTNVSKLLPGFYYQYNDKVNYINPLEYKTIKKNNNLIWIYSLFSVIYFFLKRNSFYIFNVLIRCILGCLTFIFLIIYNILIVLYLIFIALFSFMVLLFPISLMITSYVSLSKHIYNFIYYILV